LASSSDDMEIEGNGQQKEAVMIPMGEFTVDKFILWRITDGKVEILVKYKHMGYIHAEWLSRQELESRDKALKARIKRFLDKNPWDLQWSEDDPFNPDYCKVCFILTVKD